MLGAWIGSLRHLLVRKHVKVDGPDALTSSAYTAQFERGEEPGRRGLDHAHRGPAADGALLQLQLGHHGRRSRSSATSRVTRSSLADTARLFAAVHAAMTDSLIQCWRLKRDVGFWRPTEAIRDAERRQSRDDRGQTWSPLVPTPPYSDYVSGHGVPHRPGVEVIRQTLGESTPLELISVNSPTPRTYAKLRDLEKDAFNARIWSGLHFRTAMADAYRIGHITARRVLKALD